MLDDRLATPRRLSQYPPFPRILCALDGREHGAAAVQQAIAVAGGEARIAFATTPDPLARDAVARALERARRAGLHASEKVLHETRLGDALVTATATHDLVVAAAPPHGRVTGIVRGETATLLVHRSGVPVLVARDRLLSAGIVAATSGHPADRAALTAAVHLATWLGAPLTVLHVVVAGEHDRQAEIQAELTNARALLGQDLSYVTEIGEPGQAIAAVAARGNAGLVVLGSTGRRGLSAIGSVSERVAHGAPCSVLVLRDR
jgi:nucleotide-binding universal stress UspA family protein